MMHPAIREFIDAVGAEDLERSKLTLTQVQDASQRGEWSNETLTVAEEFQKPERQHKGLTVYQDWLGMGELALREFDWCVEPVGFSAEGTRRLKKGREVVVPTLSCQKTLTDAEWDEAIDSYKALVGTQPTHAYVLYQLREIPGTRVQIGWLMGRPIYGPECENSHYYLVLYQGDSDDTTD